MTDHSLAAIIYEPGQGEAVDALLAAIAVRLSSGGRRLAGATQRPAVRADRCFCDMILTDLSTGADTTISEDRGPLAKGCRLDARSLETVVGVTMAVIEAGGAELLIVNKFGRRESEGGGFRAAIAQAVAEGIPVLAGVSRSYEQAWKEFAGRGFVALPAEPGAVEAWLARVFPVPATAGANREHSANARP